MEKLLQRGAKLDELRKKPNFELGRNGLETVSPLPLAVLKGRMDIVQLLVQYRADLNNQEYSLKTGVTQATWSGHAVSAAVFLGQAGCVQALAELRASLHQKASNGANQDAEGKETKARVGEGDNVAKEEGVNAEPEALEKAEEEEEVEDGSYQACTVELATYRKVPKVGGKYNKNKNVATFEQDGDFVQFMVCFLS